MADDVVSLNSGWKQIRREATAPRSKSIVRVRRSGDIALSSNFVRMARIEQETRADIFVSSDGYKVGLNFHVDDDRPNSFQLCKDGGSGLRSDAASGRVIQVSSIKNQSTVFAKTLSLPMQDRTFTPRKDVNGLWVIELRPAFEERARGTRGEIPVKSTGIYRYVLGGETVYIGRGVLSERFASPERDGWQFDSIEYSILNSSESEAKWEAYWLNRFREVHHRWPVYNRIGGMSVFDKEASFG